MKLMRKHNAKENKLDTDILGEVASYDGSGFVRDLDGRNRTAYMEALDELKSNFWVDRQTRAVVVSLNLYNGNYNYYCVSQVLFSRALMQRTLKISMPTWPLFAVSARVFPWRHSRPISNQ